MNYLRPGIKRGSFTPEEDDLIIQLHSVHGNRWSFIATELKGRTDNEIKNHWNSHLKRKTANSSGDQENPETNKKPRKKRRNTNSKSTKVKPVNVPVPENIVPQEIVPQPASSYTSLTGSSSQSGSFTLRKTDSFDSVMMSGSSSSSSVDQGVEADLLATDFSWPSWAPMFEIDQGVGSTMNGPDGHDLPFEICDLLMSNVDESEMLDKLYSEYLNLIEDGQQV